MKSRGPIHVRQVQLALLALGAGGFLLLAGVDRASSPLAAERPAAKGMAALPSDSAGEPALSRASLASVRRVERVPSAARNEASTSTPLPAAPRKEREFLEVFLALESAHPGTLEERAEELLAGNGPKAEKVAFLRALEQSGSQQRLVWLERTASSQPEDSDAHGVSLARYSLDRLVDAARADDNAVPALRRLAFETRRIAPELRRSAALGLAQSAGESELSELSVALARETDAVLVAGVVEALRERPDSPQAARLVGEYSAAGWVPRSTDE